MYNTEKFNKVVDNCDKIGFSLFRHTEGETTVEETLAAVEGWMGYTGITEEEFNQLINLS